MSHIRTFAEAAPEAAPIIHLGATSDFINGNCDAIQMRDALLLIKRRLAGVIGSLKARALEYANQPILGYTHLQPAQPTTLGKRIALWMYDLVLDYNDLDRRVSEMVTRGAKGTTGTQASYLKLFEGDGAKVRELDRKVCEKLGFDKAAAVTGQTMTRKFDFQLLSVLAGIASSAHRAANDVRLMQHNAEVEEPFSEKQVGSSAMPYKRNPILAERCRPSHAT
jgi:adenylosuccinate lyase